MYHKNVIFLYKPNQRRYWLPSIAVRDADEIMDNTYGALSSAPDNAIIDNIYDYVTLILSGFKGKRNENENTLTNKLCKTLNSKRPSEYPFFFHHQNLEDDKENTSTDLLAFINQKTLLSIYSSVSHRIYGDDISLRHFWIDISKQEN